MKRTKGLFKIYLAIAIVGAGLVVFAYVAVQQTLRLGANDLPRQLAQDAAARLDASAKPDEVAPAGPKVDVEHSLAPFLVVVDKDINVLASTANMGTLPLPPKKAFTEIKSTSKESSFTWQPKTGVRQAAVIVPYNGGYVLAAHSMRSLEFNLDRITRLAILTLLVIVAAPATILVMLP